MQTTRISFLERLVDGDECTWRDFDAIYKPLLRHWLKNNALSHADIEDLIQEVMVFVAERLRDFKHNTRTGAFRKWLRIITVNISRNYLRKIQCDNRNSPALVDLQVTLEQLEDPNSSVSIAFERDYQKALLHRMLRRSANAFTPETMNIFHHYVLEGADVVETATAYNVSKAAVYIAKSRVLKKLREEWNDQFEAFE
ncbi:sigma-70 family RNA polymerase sigma factor [Candidatus Halobeggiatoa sp. HSG11]|nr:sigma-70 family RNA polymerase sigma factor [Candidatus Halobeggiatoa sp. HSG11]